MCDPVTAIMGAGMAMSGIGAMQQQRASQQQAQAYRIQAQSAIAQSKGQHDLHMMQYEINRRQAEYHRDHAKDINTSTRQQAELSDRRHSTALREYLARRGAGNVRSPFGAFAATKDAVIAGAAAERRYDATVIMYNGQTELKQAYLDEQGAQFDAEQSKYAAELALIEGQAMSGVYTAQAEATSLAGKGSLLGALGTVAGQASKLPVFSS